MGGLYFIASIQRRECAGGDEVVGLGRISLSVGRPDCCVLIECFPSATERSIEQLHAMNSPLIRVG